MAVAWTASSSGSLVVLVDFIAGRHTPGVPVD